ncbi:DUF1758 domain-containing protein [Trichonephila clavipes]|nr:DUF1758 domain-containing protein [Trichonephila clavipes]
MGKETKVNQAKSLSTVNEQQKPRSAMRMLSNQISSLDVKEFWSLETNGIRNPIENLKGKELNSESIKRFENDLDILPYGKYQLRVPFKIENSLASNKNITWKRHQKMCQGIIKTNCFDDYVSVFKEWRNPGIIERVPDNEINNDRYLPHRPVLTPAKIRSVFDTTAREWKTFT